VTEVLTVIGRNENNVPNIRYSPPISQRTIADLGEGVYYFALRYVTSQGQSSIGRFTINIDKTKPDSFEIINTSREDSINPLISFATKDILSGISHYKILMEDGQIFEIFEDSVSDFELVSEKSGTQIITVQAFDNAGNMTESFIEVNFTTSTSFVQTPTITSIPEKIGWREYFIVKGNAQPEKNIRLNLVRGNKIVFSFDSSSDVDGGFIFVVPTRLRTGFHSLYVEYINISNDEQQSQQRSSSSLVEIVPSRIVQIAFTVIEYFVSGLVICIAIISFVKIVMYLILDTKNTFKFLRRDDD
jgi:hypothetical protein